MKLNNINEALNALISITHSVKAIKDYAAQANPQERELIAQQMHATYSLMFAAHAELKAKK